MVISRCALRSAKRMKPLTNQFPISFSVSLIAFVAVPVLIYPVTEVGYTPRSSLSLGLALAILLAVISYLLLSPRKIYSWIFLVLLVMMLLFSGAVVYKLAPLN